MLYQSLPLQSKGTLALFFNSIRARTRWPSTKDIEKQDKLQNEGNQYPENKVKSKKDALKPNEMHGRDRMHPYSLRDLSDFISVPSTKNVKLSTETGKIPLE